MSYIFFLLYNINYFKIGLNLFRILFLSNSLVSLTVGMLTLTFIYTLIIILLINKNKFNGQKNINN